MHLESPQPRADIVLLRVVQLLGVEVPHQLPVQRDARQAQSLLTIPMAPGRPCFSALPTPTWVWCLHGCGGYVWCLRGCGGYVGVGMATGLTWAVRMPQPAGNRAAWLGTWWHTSGGQTVTGRICRCSNAANTSFRTWGRRRKHRQAGSEGPPRSPSDPLQSHPATLPQHVQTWAELHIAKYIRYAQRKVKSCRTENCCKNLHDISCV